MDRDSLKCKNCGSVVETYWKFCKSCGSLIEKVQEAQVPDEESAQEEGSTPNRRALIISLVALVTLVGLLIFNSLSGHQEKTPVSAPSKSPAAASSDSALTPPVKSSSEAKPKVSLNVKTKTTSIKSGGSVGTTGSLNSLEKIRKVFVESGLCEGTKKTTDSAFTCDASIMFADSGNSVNIKALLAVFVAPQSMIVKIKPEMLAKYPTSFFLDGDGYTIWLPLSDQALKYKSQIIESISHTLPVTY